MDSAKGSGGVTGVPPAFGMALLSFQFVLIVLYALCTEDLYERQYMEVSSTDNKTMIHDPLTDEILYRNYVDVALMMLVGFGYLMTFLRYYGLGAVGECRAPPAQCLQSSSHRVSYRSASRRHGRGSNRAACTSLEKSSTPRPLLA